MRTTQSEPRESETKYRSRVPLRTLAGLLRADRKHLLRALALFLVKSTPLWVLPVTTANIIDIVSNPQNHNLRDIWINAAVVLIAVIQNPFTHTAYWNEVSIAIRNMEVRMRSDICRRLQFLSISYLKRSSTGVLHAKITRDVEQLEQMLRISMEGILGATLNVLISFTVAAFRAPGFLPFFLATIPLGVGLRMVLRKRLQDRNRAFRKDVEQMSARIFNMIEMIPVTRAHAAEEAELDDVSERLQTVKSSALRLDNANGWFSSLSWALFTGLNASCLIVAGWACYTQTIKISPGDVVLLTTYFGVISGSVMQIANATPQITKGVESLRSIAEVMESPDLEHNQGKAAVRSVRGAFDLRDVSFSYPDEKGGALDRVNLQVSAGETIGVVGPSGSGKSTLMSLLLGFHRPVAGKILLDGVDMNQLDLRTYRRFVAVVAQETLLFPGTVKENLTYGLPDVSDAAVRTALEGANAAEFVANLPDGLETQLGERGARLSGGQRQRLAIARALIREPRVLFLDEATSALDAASELQVQEALDRLMAGRTTFVVAHRLATIRRATRILVLEEGRITEQGSHAELLRVGGLYSQLHEMQRLTPAPVHPEQGW